ncbi:histidine kinase [Streptomyces sp. DW26H14]|uniref:histidine kinase n=1 Tax=Streptomyces sp. DW26H14 TaxID=3435395 RepID=UPI00403E255F
MTKTRRTRWRSDPTTWRAFERRDLIGATMMVICLGVTVLAAEGTTTRIAVGALGIGVEAGLLLDRRRPPSVLGAAGVVLTIGAGLAMTVLAPEGLGEVPVLVGAAALPLRLPRGPVRSAAIGVVAVAFGITIMEISHSLAGLLAGAGSWFLSNRSLEHAALQTERDRAVALLAEVEASRQALQEAAAVEERGRIAREMHDVLAHSLAGLSVQLQAVRAVAGREGAPAVLTEPLDRAAQLARDGVQEARAAVGALRAAPLRGVADLQGLIRGFPGEARLRTTGEVGRVGPDAGHAVYRAVQEAMTNAARYATGSAIEVDVAWSERELRVTVRDHGRPAGRAPSGVRGSGTGLRSMTERIEAVGGTLAAGPAPEGKGWRIEAQVPVAATGGADAAGTGTDAGPGTGTCAGTGDGTGRIGSVDTSAAARRPRAGGEADA